MDRGRAPNGIGHLMILFLILWHVKTTSWVWSQRADSDSESPPERPGTQTNGYFHIKHVMQQAKSHHMEG